MPNQTKWICPDPECKSDRVQGLAWLWINSEALASWDEDRGFFCQECEDRGRDGHHKSLEETQLDRDGRTFDEWWEHHYGRTGAACGSCRQGQAEDHVSELREGGWWFRCICPSCREPGDVEERYSFGIYAGRFCLKCCGRYRDNCGEDQPQGDPAILEAEGERVEPEDGPDAWNLNEVERG
jgi:hypothetical protein